MTRREWTLADGYVGGGFSLWTNVVVNEDGDAVLEVEAQWVGECGGYAKLAKIRERGCSLFGGGGGGSGG
jgi:hypothetical protein